MVAAMLVQFSASQQHGVVVALNYEDKGVRLGYDQGARVDQAHRHRLAVAPSHRSWPAQPAGLIGRGYGHGGRSHDLRPGDHPPRHRRGTVDHRDGRRASAGQLGRPRNRTTESPLRRTSGRAAFFIFYSS